MSENVTENCDYHNSYDDETDSYDDDLWCSCDECYAEIDVWCESRYYWINTTHVMNMTPHIEVRLHSGTLDYTKVKNWHSLMKRFIEYGMNNTYNGVVSIQDLFDTLELPKNEQLYWFQRRELFRDNLQRTSVESGELTENNQ